MNVLDLVFAILLLIGAYRGYQKGLVLEVIAILSFIIGVAAAFALLQWGIDLLNKYIDLPSNIVPIIAFSLILLGVIIGLNALGKMAKKAIDLTLVGSLDSFAGGIVGLAKSAFFISVVIWIFSSIGLEFFGDIIDQSRIYAYVEPVAPYAFEYLSFLLPFIKDLYESVKEQLKP